MDGSKIGEAALPYVDDLISKLSPVVKVEVILLQVLSKLTYPLPFGNASMGAFFVEEDVKKRKKQAVYYLNKVGEALRSKGATVTVEVRPGRVPEEIVKTAEKANVNMIVMSTHRRTGFSRWTFGSVTDKVLRLEGNIPIFMVRAPKLP